MINGCDQVIKIILKKIQLLEFLIKNMCESLIKNLTYLLKIIQKLSFTEKNKV